MKEFSPDEGSEVADKRREPDKNARVLLSGIEVAAGGLAGWPDLAGCMWMSEVPGSACRLLELATEPMTEGIETLREWTRR